MSHVEGTDDLMKKLEGFGKTLSAGAFEIFDREMVATQKEAVSLIPVDTGRASSALASEEALIRETDAKSGTSRWTFGMTTLKIQRAAFYLFFIEFGRKGSSRGELLNPGVKDKRSRSGRTRRARRRRRSVAPMPARPWFRPARDHLFDRLREVQGFDDLVRASKRLAGLADGK